MSEMRQRFLFAARLRLLHQLISGWRRRGSSLLQIGLNAGTSPEIFWEAGFDVTAADPSPARLEAAHAQTGPKVSYVCAKPDLLPFDDGHFDYAVLVHQGLTRSRAGGSGESLSGDDALPELAEALRVASRGIIVLEWNRFSLPGVPHPLLDASPDEGRRGEDAGVWPWELWGLLGRFCPKKSRKLRSVLPLWSCTWPACAPDEGKGLAAAWRKALVPCNLSPVPLPFGALLGVRVDWISVPLTPAGMLCTAAERLLSPAKPREGVLGRGAETSASPTSFSPQKRKQL